MLLATALAGNLGDFPVHLRKLMGAACSTGCVSQCVIPGLDISTGKQYLMRDDSFEWDDTKNSENYTQHGVRFERARNVFLDAFAVDQLDDRFDPPEERFSVTGMVEGTLLFVIFVEHGNRIRIISARRANTYEQDDYFEANRSDGARRH